MSNLDEPPASNGDGDERMQPETMSRLALEARVLELEKENASLRPDIEALNLHIKRDSALLHAWMIAGIPLDRHELEELKANSCSLDDLLAEVEKLGLSK